MSRRSATNRQCLPLELYADRSKLLSGQGDDADIDLRFRMTATQAIKESSISRAQIAAAMTDSMYGDGGDQEVTVSQLNTWTAPSRSDRRFPVSHLPALVQATGAIWLLDLIARACDCVVVKADEAWLLELAAATALQRRAETRVKELSEGMSAEMVEALTARITGGRS